MTAVVPAALDGERLDRVVALLTGGSRVEAAALVAGGAVRLDGRVASRRAARVATGGRIDIEIDVDRPDPLIGPGVEPAPSVPVVYADEHVLVVDKPPGLVVHPGAGNRQGTLAHALVARYPELAGVGPPERPGMVHRLDKGTSGLLVVARTPAAYEALVAQLAARTVERRYAALVWGHPSPPRGVVDAPLGRSRRHPTRMAVSASGRPARTAYHVERRFAHPAAVALLVCRLESGRTHQVRVHLAALRHPVVGDDRYGGRRSPLAAPRPLLHAQHLGFDHPGSGRRVGFDAPLPPDLAAVLDGLAEET